MSFNSNSTRLLCSELSQTPKASAELKEALQVIWSNLQSATGTDRQSCERILK